jgi:RecA-family ATPase
MRAVSEYRASDGKSRRLFGVSAASYAGKDVAPREFLDMAEIFPARTVAMLSGDGGTGKSLLALQLALAMATATPWLGIEIMSGPVLYVSAEDDEAEMANRLQEIAAADELDLAAASSLIIVHMAGDDATLGYEENRGTVKKTELYNCLDETIDYYSPALVILDGLADVFAGNENNRSGVKHFVNLLRRLALKHDCIVLLLAHPSLFGLKEGTGTSGSTGWRNSVRVMLYLRRVIDSTNIEADKHVRVLETMKANYAATGNQMDLRWENHRFVRKPRPSIWDNVGVSHLEQVAQIFAAGDYRVSDRSESWGGYAVAEVLHLDVGRGLAADERTPEQQKARDKVRKVLAKWAATPGSGIRIVVRNDATRRPREFYAG